MVGRKLPVFQKGKILTKEMLQSLRDYVVCEGETAYRDYADGILYGCQVTATQDVITVHPGAIVMAGVVYYLTEAISVEYAPANQWMILKIRAGEQSISENFELFGLEIVLEPETAPCKGCCTQDAHIGGYGKAVARGLYPGGSKKPGILHK